MNQPFFLIVFSILASMFFGVISNWIYDILRQRELLPDKPKLKKIIIISLVGLAFIFLTNLKPATVAKLSGFLMQHSYISNWLVIITLVVTTAIGFLIGQRKAKKLNNTLRRKDRQIDELKKTIKQQTKPYQDGLEEDIINPR